MIGTLLDAQKLKTVKEETQKQEEQTEEDLVYIRSAFYRNKHSLPQKIIFGHTEFDSPLVQDDKICIDLGCGKYKNAKLCALVLDNGKEDFVYSD